MRRANAHAVGRPNMLNRLAVYSGSFNPPGVHHRAIAAALANVFDEVVIVPSGPRADRPVANDVELNYRAAMVDMAFRHAPKIRVELFDLEASTYSHAGLLDERFAPEGEVWHVVSAASLAGGGGGRSSIHREWPGGADLWPRLRFAVVVGPGETVNPADLPPMNLVVNVDAPYRVPIRDVVYRHESIDALVAHEVGRYIERHRLYRGGRAARSTSFQIDQPRYLIVADAQNGESHRVAATFRPDDAENPNLILVVGGDGAMLRAIRQHWRRRVPFYGVNVGHTGFLLNDGPTWDIAGNPLVLHQLPLLWVETDGPRGRQTSLAFNDAWVERATGQTAWIQVRVNGVVRVERVMGDGVLVATPAGSTSYARAMGAPPLPMNTPAIVLVGSNVLRPEKWKPVVLSNDVTIELTTLDARKRPLRAYIDGVLQGEIHTLRTRLSNIATVELAFDPRHDPAEKLAEIQFPPLDE